MNAPVDFVFLHGGGQAGWVWDETLAALALQTGGGFGRALTLDIPGCGSKRGRPTALDEWISRARSGGGGGAGWARAGNERAIVSKARKRRM